MLAGQWALGLQDFRTGEEGSWVPVAGEGALASLPGESDGTWGWGESSRSARLS